MKYFISSLVLFVAFSANALSLSRGYDDALDFCSKLDFSSDQEKCYAVARAERVFDSAAVDVCRTITFSSNGPNCLRAIARKDYSPVELSICRKENFDNGKITCLNQSGAEDSSPGDYCVEKNFTVGEINQALRAINRGQDQRAAQILRNLRDQILEN